MNAQTIQIIDRSTSLTDLKRELEAYQATGITYTLQDEKAHSRYRDIDTNTLVALVGLAGTGLGALIKGLFDIATQRRGAYLEISGKDWSIKVPADVSIDELDRLIEKARLKSIDKIEITR
jgi:hypothetical protein